MSEGSQPTFPLAQSDKPGLVLEFPLHEISHSINRGLQRLIDCTALSLAGANKIDAQEDLRLPDQFFQFEPASNTRLSMDGLRDVHRSWTLANCFREAVERVQQSLFIVRRFWQIREFQKTGGTHGELLKSLDVGKSFDRMPFDQKLEWASDAYGSIELKDAVLSINAARNCLTHRAGVVSQIDCDDGQKSLTVKWRKMAFILTSPDGTQREISGPTVIEGGGSLGKRLTDCNKTFDLGDRIDFAVGEIQEICFTIFLFGTQLQGAIERALQSAGMKIDIVKPPSQGSPTADSSEQGASAPRLMVVSFRFPLAPEDSEPT